MKTELARKLFYSLEKSTFYHNYYIVLNDQNFIAGFYANNDADAILIFESGAYLEEV